MNKAASKVMIRAIAELPAVPPKNMRLRPLTL